MYEIGTLVLYDRRGVYKVENVGVPPIQGISSDHYKLCAVFSNSNEVIYAPVDMSSAMRPLISGSEASDHLELFSQLEPRRSTSKKPMELAAHYRDMLSSRKVEDCLLLIKEIHAKQREMSQQKKRLGQVDVQYLKLAEKLICEEFSIALTTTPELIRERLYAAMRRRATA